MSPHRTPVRVALRQRGNAALAALALLLAGCVLVLAGCGGGEAPKHNVLLVTLDTTRADRLGCYGHVAADTPRLDALAADGWRFDRAQSTAGITPVAHASLLTGTLPHRHGVRVLRGAGHDRLRADVTTLAEVLRPRGWRTAAMVSAYPASAAYGLDRGFERFSDGLDPQTAGFTEGPAPHWVDAPRSGFQRRADDTTDEALAWLAEVPVRGAPWLLWVHYFDAHDLQIVPPAEFLAARGERVDPSQPGNDVAVRDAFYDTELAFQDAQLGRLLDAVAARAEMDETIVVVAADHGQGLLDGARRHDWHGHRILYEWCTRVPLVVRLPGRGAGAVDALVSLVDVAPTVLEALDVGAPAALDGRSLLPLVAGAPDAPRLAFAETLTRIDEHGAIRRLPERYRHDQFAVQDARWKLVWSVDEVRPDAPGTAELYDLAADPDELVNVAAEHPAEVARLLELLRASGMLALEPASEPGGERPDSRALDGLGYTGGKGD